MNPNFYNYLKLKMLMLYKFLEWLYSDSVKYPNETPRDRPMEVLVLGMPKTGTECRFSTRKAVQIRTDACFLSAPAGID
jgi:hypothetical protein